MIKSIKNWWACLDGFRVFVNVFIFVAICLLIGVFVYLPLNEHRMAKADQISGQIVLINNTNYMLQREAGGVYKLLVVRTNNVEK